LSAPSWRHSALTLARRALAAADDSTPAGMADGRCEGELLGPAELDAQAGSQYHMPDVLQPLPSCGQAPTLCEVGLAAGLHAGEAVQQAQQGQRAAQSGGGRLRLGGKRVERVAVGPGPSESHLRAAVCDKSGQVESPADERTAACRLPVQQSGSTKQHSRVAPPQRKAQPPSPPLGPASRQRRPPRPWCRRAPSPRRCRPPAWRSGPPGATPAGHPRSPGPGPPAARRGRAACARLPPPPWPPHPAAAWPPAASAPCYRPQRWCPLFGAGRVGKGAD
jgi:hypothetical protein